MTIAVGVSDYIDVPLPICPTATAAAPSAMATTITCTSQARKVCTCKSSLGRCRVCRTPTIFMEGSSDESLVRHLSIWWPLVALHSDVSRVRLTGSYRNHSRKKSTRVQLRLLPPRPPRAIPYQPARNAQCLSHRSVVTTRRRTFESVCSHHQRRMRLSTLHRLVAPECHAQSCPRLGLHTLDLHHGHDLSLSVLYCILCTLFVFPLLSRPNLAGQIQKIHGLCPNCRPTQCRPGTTASPQTTPMFDLLDYL